MVAQAALGLMATELNSTEGHRGHLRVWAVLLVLALAVPVARALPDDGRSWAREEQASDVRQAVLEILELPDPADPDGEALLSRLRPIGSAAVAHCFDLLIDGPLSPGARTRARLALSLLDPSALWAHLAWHATNSPSIAVQSLGVELLGERGTGDQFALLCQLVEPRDDGVEELTRPLARAVEFALTAILLRDPDSYSIIEYRFARSHPALLLPIVRGIGGTRSKRALELLPYLLLGEEGFDALVLNQLALVCTERRRPTSEDTRARARRCLSSLTGKRAARQAVLAAAMLEDYGAVPILIELLEDEDQVLARDAHWALRRLTGLSFRLDARRWREWLDEEVDFWDLRADELFELLDRGEAELARVALSEISDHRGYRHDLAREVAVVLGRPEEQLVMQALNVLEKLDSLAVMDDLIELVDDARAPVATEARRVLVSLTGEDHGEDPMSWREAYSSSS